MTYELASPSDAPGAVVESSEYRRTHFRIYDEDGFSSTFDTNPPESATLSTVLACVIETFHGTGGSGYDSKDLVVLLGPRIVAVIRSGHDGQPVVTTFES